MKLPIFLSSLLISTIVLAPVAAPAAPAPKPSLCFVTEWCNGEQEDVPLVAELRAAGFLIDNMGIQDLTAAKMAHYNALIFPEFPRPEPLLKPGENMAWQVRPDYLPPFNAAIDAYVKNGGGVVVYGVCFFQTQVRGMVAMNQMMAPWGAATLYEQVLNPDRTYRYKQVFEHHYSWTSNFAKHPLTAGLKRAFYCTDSAYGPMTCTFRLSKDWTVLVRGEATARSVPYDLDKEMTGTGPGLQADKKGTYDSAPPLIAVRAYGKGRVAVIGMTPVMAVFGARFSGYGNVLLDAGDGNLKSDFGKLQERIYRWAAAPGWKAGAPGGYVEKPHAPFVNPNVSPPVDWAKYDFGENGIKPLRGLIGARTAAGGGAGSVKDYVAAAEQAGLDFIGFTEDFTRLDAKKWAVFQRECREASTEKVAAIPGFLYRDNVGARWVALGEFSFPKKNYLSADGQRLIQPMWFPEAGFCFNGPIDVGHNPRPFWTYSLYSAMAVKTFASGRLVDDATDAYLDRQEIEDVLAPFVVDLLRSPAEVVAARAHTTAMFASSRTDLMFGFNRTDKNTYTIASTGPLITDWRAVNPLRDTRGSWQALAGTERLAVRFAAKSVVGLKSVSLLDGPHVLRRFDAKGAHEFARTVNLNHDRQRHLIVVAEDVAGQRAISGAQNTRDQLNFRFLCGDRCNSICDGFLRTATGRVFINGPTAPYQRKNTLWPIFPGYSDLWTAFAAPYTDGGIQPVQHSATPSVQFQGGNGREGSMFASRMVHPLSSRDVIIQEGKLCGWYTNPYASPYVPAEVIEPLHDFTATIRWVEFVKRYRDPGFTLVEGTITFLRDGELEPGVFLNPSLHKISSASMDSYDPCFSIVGRTHDLLAASPAQEPTPDPSGGGESYSAIPLLGGARGGSSPRFMGTENDDLAGITQEHGPHVEGAMNEGGFVAFLPSFCGAGATLMLEPGYRFQGVMGRPRATAQFGLAMGGQKVAKGQQIHYRFLAGRGVIGAEPTDGEWRAFRAAMGLTGAPAYTLSVTQGKVNSTRYVLDADAVEGGFAAKVGKASLPVRLPICVHGVNPKWSAAIYNRKDGYCLPIGVIETENKAYATWDTTSAAADLYVGNVLTCDAPQLILTAVREGNRWIVEAHNPTESVVKATVKGAAGFDPLAGFQQPVVVPPGSSLELHAAK